MSDVSSRILKNSFFVYLGKIVNLSITFFVFVHLANYLGKNAFGRLSVAITYIATFGVLSNFGLNQILVRELSTKQHDSNLLLSNSIILKAILSFFSIILGLIGTFFLDYSRETTVLIWIISFNLLISSKLSSTRTIFEAYFQANLKMVFPIFFNFIDNLLFASLIFFYTIKYKVGLFEIAIIYVVCNLPGTILLLVKFFKSVSLKLTIRFVAIKNFIKESFPLFLYIFFSTLNTKIDILLLSWMKGDEEVGYFSAASRLVYPLMFLSTSLSISLFPILSKYYKEKRNEFQKYLKIGMKYILLIAIFLSTTLSFHAHKLITTLYESGYEPATDSFKILIIALGIYFIVFYFVDIFIAARSQKMITIIMALGLVLNVVLNLILIPKLGFVGSSYVRLLTYFFLFIMFLIFSHNKLKIKGIIDFLKMSTLLILFIIAQTIFLNLHIVVSLLLSGIIYVVLIMVLKVISKQEVLLFTKIFNKRNKQFV